jgi:hypothetical protein
MQKMQKILWGYMRPKNFPKQVYGGVKASDCKGFRDFEKYSKKSV